jgi:hypothetical protein
MVKLRSSKNVSLFNIHALDHGSLMLMDSRA